MAVTKDQIRYLAELAKLKFSDEELKKFEKEFNNIIEYVSKVNTCDVEGIEIEHNLQDYKDEVLQDDTPEKFDISRDEYLQNATDGRTKNGMIVVKRTNS